MKKVFLLATMTVLLVLGARAQGRETFFTSDWDDNDRLWGTEIGLVMPSSAIGTFDNGSGAPLGSGLLILTALGAGYAITKRKR